MNSTQMKKPQPLTTLLASAQRLGQTDIKTKKKRSGSATGGSWQDDAWDMYDLVGEQRFLATNLAGQLAKAHLFVGKVTPGADAPERLEDGEGQLATRLLDSFGSSDAGRAQILNRLAVNLFIPGEGWIVGIPPQNEEQISGDDLRGNTPGAPDGLMLTQRIGQAADAEPEKTTALDRVDVEDLEWRMLSVSEVSINSTTGMVELQLDDGEKAEYDPDDLYLIRVWRPHPRKWWEADSPTRSSLPVLKELVGLTMHVSAQVDSRLAGAGLLVLPQSVQRALAAQAGNDPEADGDQFTDSLIEAMLTPISDRASASAVVPLVVTVPDDAVEQIRHISFAQPLDEKAQTLRDEAIRRLALGQDAPPELLLGTGNMNHWGGWLVQQETVSTHIEPVLALICDALTTQFLWDALIENGVEPEEAQKYVVWYDVDHLIARPNLGSDALALHERGAISDDVLRRAHGYDETDAPQETAKADDDPALSLVLDMIRTAPSLAQSPGIPELVRQLRDVLAAGTGLPAPSPAAGTAEAPGEGEGDAEPAGAIPATDGDPAELPGPEG